MEPEALLLLLQHGDSAFPSGGFAFSSGLEELIATGVIAGPADVSAFLADVLVNRWSSFDRPMLRAAHAAGSLDEVAALDRMVEMCTWSEPMRQGSRRAGRALLGVHARLAAGDAALYRRRVETEAELGHLPVVQGLVWRIAGLEVAAAEALSAYALLQGLLQAALRLGLVGHLAAQTLMAEGRAIAARLLPERPVDAGAAHAFTPLADIALAGHMRRDGRLFAT